MSRAYPEEQISPRPARILFSARHPSTIAHLAPATATIRQHVGDIVLFEPYPQVLDLTVGFVRGEHPNGTFADTAVRCPPAVPESPRKDIESRMCRGVARRAALLDNPPSPVVPAACERVIGPRPRRSVIDGLTATRLSRKPIRDDTGRIRQNSIMNYDRGEDQIVLPRHNA
ncbi:hypothetical protein [Nocardia asiatica]|uniref:hypothetical protein n=1 Tax=Nocardia asiatica TaxID=209252 RepID=UPI003CC7EAAA